MKHTLRFQLSGQVSITLNLIKLLCVYIENISETDMKNWPENAEYFPDIILISLILLYSLNFFIYLYFF